jgi:hypothetical protein
MALVFFGVLPVSALRIEETPFSFLYPGGAIDRRAEAYFSSIISGVLTLSGTTSWVIQRFNLAGILINYVMRTSSLWKTRSHSKWATGCIGPGAHHSF